MPRLVKGGKWVFGWSKVSGKGKIVIPPETLDEYEIHVNDEMVLMSGSKTSGGFSAMKLSRMERSKLSALIDTFPELRMSPIPGDGVVRKGNRVFYRTSVKKGGSITLAAALLAEYGVKTGDSLLVARGSGLAPGFIVRGPIVEEARRHPELEVFEYTG
jgi:bifunctional DNA-binding transcriptional regulator/antitoxin component of YhaV-PrlF toxin-antitoxin module